VRRALQLYVASALLVGLALLTATGVKVYANWSDEPDAKAAGTNRHSISPQQYGRVHVGMPRWVVRGLLGEPVTDVFPADDPCIYYAEQYRVARTEDRYGEPGDIVSEYQFCFGDDNRLKSKGPGSTGSEAEQAGIEPLEEPPSYPPSW
jgi:hypothetical protein